MDGLKILMKVKRRRRGKLLDLVVIPYSLHLLAGPGSRDPAEQMNEDGFFLGEKGFCSDLI